MFGFSTAAVATVTEPRTNIEHKMLAQRMCIAPNFMVGRTYTIRLDWSYDIRNERGINCLYPETLI
jgi:hypothetical protein